jgi:hypothetical protein
MLRALPAPGWQRGVSDIYEELQAGNGIETLNIHREKKILQCKKTNAITRISWAKQGNKRPSRGKKNAKSEWNGDLKQIQPSNRSGSRPWGTGRRVQFKQVAARRLSLSGVAADRLRPRPNCGPNHEFLPLVQAHRTPPNPLISDSALQVSLGGTEPTLSQRRGNQSKVQLESRQNRVDDGILRLVASQCPKKLRFFGVRQAGGRDFRESVRPTAVGPLLVQEKARFLVPLFGVVLVRRQSGPARYWSTSHKCGGSNVLVPCGG